MSEKRFTYRWGSDIDYEQEIFYDNHKPIGFVEVVGLLNDLVEENKEIKKENEKLKIALSEYGVDFSSLDRFKEAIGYNEMVKKELEE